MARPAMSKLQAYESRVITRDDTTIQSAATGAPIKEPLQQDSY